MTLAFTIAGPSRPFSRQTRVKKLVGGAADGVRSVEGAEQEEATNLLVALERFSHKVPESRVERGAFRP